MKQITKNLHFEFSVDPDKFLEMDDKDRELMLDSMSEEEKIEKLRMFKTLKNGKVGWNHDKDE